MNEQQETKAHQHKEAFCLMRYRCEVCGTIELFWNSRDGVTPFIVTGECLNCWKGDMMHIDWSEDQYAPNHVPEPGQGVFFDMPESFKRPAANWRITLFEVPEDRIEQTRNQIMASFEPGTPWFIRW